jgi:hypothetical protein
MSKGKPLTATALRLILIVSMFIIAALGVVGFSFVSDGLRETANNVSQTVAEAGASQNNVQVLQQIQTKLAEDKDAVERARSIVAESQSYQYQDQIIKDLTDYANRSRIGITNIDFAATKSSSTQSTTQTPAPQQSTAPSGVNSTIVTITLENPVDYTSLLRFIHAIEQNLTKMQISQVGISKDPTGKVTSETLAIEVYVR